jgi:hypothetical protein
MNFIGSRGDSGPEFAVGFYNQLILLDKAEMRGKNISPTFVQIRT